MEVLTAFVRKNSPIPAEIRELDDQSEEKIKALEKLEPVNIQLQTALTVIVRRDPDQDKTQEDKSTKTIDLSNSNLVRANLADANIQDADLFRANLRYAILVGVKNLSKTQIKSACFWEAAYYNQDRQANVQKIEEIRQDKASDPKNPPDC